MPNARWTRFHIEKMDCPSEEALIRKRLAPLDGVQGLEFNLIQRTLTVHHDLPSFALIGQALASIGMEAQVQNSSEEQNSTLSISKMDCPTEEALIRNRLGRLSGISALEFNLVQRQLKLRHDSTALPAVLAALKEIGLPADEAAVTDAKQGSRLSPKGTQPWWPLAVSGLSALAAEIVNWLTHDSAPWLVVALALLAIGTGGLSTYKKGWIALRHRNLNMNALMSVAVTGAMMIGQWPEAAMVMFLFALAELIEAKSLDRARNAIRGLMDLAPETATVLGPEGVWRKVPAADVAIGALVRVIPGECIALDGEIVSGHSIVNQAPITGESMPVDKAPEDKVFAGTINGAGSFDYRVTAPANATTLARIIHAVESAQGAKAPTQRFVDRFAQVYTPAVFVLALAVALLPPLLFGAPWLTWIYRSLVILVIACPCALVIATPVTIVSGLTAAARRGILVKGGVHLEGGRRLNTIALDKTGTLTHGRPEQTDMFSLDTDEQHLSSIVASLAVRSDHPVSQALMRAAERDAVPTWPTHDFAALPGFGIRGTVNDVAYHLCNPRWTEDRFGALPQALNERLRTLEQKGNTVVLLSDPDRILGAFAVADTVKETSREAIAELHSLGVRTLMLTGDNPSTAQTIAAQVGIDEARGHQLPEDKLRYIEQISQSGSHVGMVGDGINDAPALARADIGFAMGAIGSDTAIETADVALMDDDLRKVPQFIRLSRATSRILVQNISLALGIKALFLGLTFTTQATMWMAVFADMGTSLLVVFNGLRLLGERGESSRQAHDPLDTRPAA